MNIVNGEKHWPDFRFCGKSQNIFLEKQVIPLPFVIYGRRKRSDCLQERKAGCVIGEGSSGMKSPQESPLPSPSVNCSPDIQIISKLDHDQITWRSVLVALRKTTATTQIEKGKLCMIDPFVVFQQNTSK